MKNIVQKIDTFDTSRLLYTEWLLTNGLGGFACGNLANVPMRKYHSLLTAALPTPYGRTIMLNFVEEIVTLSDQKQVKLSYLRGQAEGPIESHVPKEFRLENGLPIWVYEIDGVIIEKRLLLIYYQNTLHMSYTLKSDHSGVSIKWRPYLHFRANEQPVNVKIDNEAYVVHTQEHLFEIQCPGFPALRLHSASKSPFTIDHLTAERVFYEMEAERGYESIGDLKSPGLFVTPLEYNTRVTLIASTEEWDTIFSLNPPDAWLTENLRKDSILTAAGFPLNSFAAKLALAADQFIINPTTRHHDMVRLQAQGAEVKSVIAGFPWFTDWGRDTMISLEGLTLTTNRFRHAYAILYTFSHYIHDGLIPNMFPEGENKGIYNTADATLWFFHAIDRYVAYSQDEDIISTLLPKLTNIIDCHIKGTDFGIRMDTDGLLIQGAPHVQLTWMDAKVGDWVVTPRRGKAVEINALWYNALCLLEKWSKKPPELSKQCYESFNKKFWFEEGRYLYDVIEGEDGKNDASLRPNQLFAISLNHPVLQQDRWQSVLDAVTRELLTPVGLRTLSPNHPDYKAKYDGNLRARDAAYHQGSVWPWLIGPYMDTWLKVHPHDVIGAKKILNGLETHLEEFCIGTIGELFDATPPYHARGCFAQAWSIAEFLRCLVKIGKN